MTEWWLVSIGRRVGAVLLGVRRTLTRLAIVLVHTEEETPCDSDRTSEFYGEIISPIHVSI